MAQGDKKSFKRKTESKKPHKTPKMKKGRVAIGQWRQEKGQSRQLAAKLDKNRTGIINTNIDEIMASKVLFAGGKLTLKDLKQRGKERLRDAKDALKKKESTRRSKSESIKDSIIKVMNKEEKDFDKATNGTEIVEPATNADDDD